MLEPAFWAACLAPLARLAWDAYRTGLGANPIQELTLRTGRWALILLLATLAVTPVRRLTGWNRVIGLRRPLGLFAFFYASLHFMVYLAVDMFFAWGDVLADIAQRPFITAGFAAFALMIPLAATSTRAAIRRLGTRWRTLHRLVYLVAVLAFLHFLWLVKAPAIGRPIRYGAVLLVLLGVRVWTALRARRRGRGHHGTPRGHPGQTGSTPAASR